MTEKTIQEKTVDGEQAVKLMDLWDCLDRNSRSSEETLRRNHRLLNKLRLGDEQADVMNESGNDEMNKVMVLGDVQGDSAVRILSKAGAMPSPQQPIKDSTESESTMPFWKKAALVASVLAASAGGSGLVYSLLPNKETPAVTKPTTDHTGDFDIQKGPLWKGD